MEVLALRHMQRQRTAVIDGLRLLLAGILLMSRPAEDETPH
jgi:hypothetical protein